MYTKNKRIKMLFQKIYSVGFVCLLTFLSLGLSFLSKGLSLDGNTSVVSPVLIAIIIGMFISNMCCLGGKFNFGIELGTKYILKLGVVLLGFGISIFSLLHIAELALPVAILTISTGVLVSYILGKILGISFKLSLLIGVGTSICGITAIVATSPLLESKKTETAYAITVIALLGTISMLFYPYIVSHLFEISLHKGVFLGASVPDTSQAVGAGLIYTSLHMDNAVLDATIATKLIRNSLMVAIIPIVAYLYYQNEKGKNNEAEFNYSNSFPLFIIGFIVLAIIRSIGDIYLLNETYEIYWTNAISYVLLFSKSFCLVYAMASIGLSTNIKKMFSIGLRPLILGLVVIIAIAIVNYASIFYIYNNFIINKIY